jgi:hypothetical protein
MGRIRKLPVFAVAVAVAVIMLVDPSGARADTTDNCHHDLHQAHLLVSGLQGTIGSTVGPDGALYIPESVTGTIARVNPRDGHTTTFASGLPRRVGDLGGAIDVAFIHHTAYALVTLVSPDVGGTSADGIYRVDGPNHVTLIADIGAYSLAHPPATDFFVPTGVQYAMQPYRGGFLVTDGHHNRVLRVSLNGNVTEVIAFSDIVPTGLALRGRTVYMAQAGPVPHLPENGKIVSFTTRTPVATEIASGAPLLVDVEFDRGNALYALSQGHFTPGHPEGSPADPNTGALELVHRDGTMTPVVTGLNQPTSLEFIHDTAYIVNLNGQVWTVDS